jgi:hypothetical protein
MAVDLTTEAKNVTKTTNIILRFIFAGLSPNTNHIFYKNGEDVSAITKQFGKDFGDTLTTNENGEIILFFLDEIPFNRELNFELPQEQTLNFENAQLNNQNARTDTRVDVTRIVFEIKSLNGQSYAQNIRERRTLINAGPTPQLFNIES